MMAILLMILIVLVVAEMAVTWRLVYWQRRLIEMQQERIARLEGSDE